MINHSTLGNIIKWMRKQVKKRNANGALVGLSGGVDSSVVAGLIKKHLIKIVLGLCFHQVVL